MARAFMENKNIEVEIKDGQFYHIIHLHTALTESEYFNLVKAGGVVEFSIPLVVPTPKVKQGQSSTVRTGDEEEEGVDIVLEDNPTASPSSSESSRQRIKEGTYTDEDIDELIAAANTAKKRGRPKKK